MSPAKSLSIVLFAGLVLVGREASAAAVTWADWTGGTAGSSGSASGVFNTADGPVSISYAGEIAFLQTGSGTNYFAPSSPYVSALVPNPPPAAEMIALSAATSKALTFTQPVEDLSFATISLNGNAYFFDRDFEIVSTGPGFWGNGVLTRTVMEPSTYALLALGPAELVARGSGTAPVGAHPPLLRPR